MPTALTTDLEEYDAIARTWEERTVRQVWMERKRFGFLSEPSETQPGQEEPFA